MGPCAGGAVYSPALTDFVVMVDQKSYMFVTGPKVVQKVTSEEIDTESLGGGRVHAEKSGVAQFLVKSEVEGLELARQILSYLPQNNCVEPPVVETDDTSGRRCERLREIVPEEANRPYDVRADIAVIANNPGVLAGVLDIDASRKAARFVRTCNAFGLPILSLIDVPGFLPGKEQEHHGIIEHGAKLAYAYCEATVPKRSVSLRKAYGGAYIVMSSKHVGGDFNLSWPDAEIAVMGAGGAVEILHGKELRQHDDPERRSQELTDSYNESFANPSIAEARGFLDAVIEPAETRRVLLRGLHALIGKREELPFKRNGNVPL